MRGAPVGLNVALPPYLPVATCAVCVARSAEPNLACVMTSEYVNGAAPALALAPSTTTFHVPARGFTTRKPWRAPSRCVMSQSAHWSLLAAPPPPRPPVVPLAAAGFAQS